MCKARIGILGTGNIGMDLLMKIMNSDMLECTMFVGHNNASENIKKASAMGIVTSTQGIEGLMAQKDSIDIIIDATNARAHKENKELLQESGKFIIDLTPTCEGMLCIPCINGDKAVYAREISMISCAGQATIPVAHSLAEAGGKISYIETVSTIASKSAGRATRENIDEFIETTAGAMCSFTKVKNTKSIMIINPNEPPVNMRNTIYVDISGINLKTIHEAVYKIEYIIQQYVPGYRIIVEPAFIGSILAVTIEVSGRGDFLPKYAGNLDIITCAAIEMASKYCENVLGRRM